MPQIPRGLRAHSDARARRLQYPRYFGRISVAAATVLVSRIRLCGTHIADLSTFAPRRPLLPPLGRAAQCDRFFASVCH